MRQAEVVTTSPEMTVALGESIGARLRVGTVIDLRGDLGAGKTHFVRGLALGLGIPSGVRSPTFTICQLHAGETPLLHVDAYRLEDPHELLLHGWDELLPRAVVAVEWGNRIDVLLPSRRVRVSIEHAGGESRRFRFEGLSDFEELAGVIHEA